MTKGIMATVLAASLVFTSISAAPAHADRSEFGKFIIGATTLFIIAGALSGGGNSNKNRHVTRHNTHNNTVYTKPSRRDVRKSCVRHNSYGQRYISQRCMSRHGY